MTEANLVMASFMIEAEQKSALEREAKRLRISQAYVVREMLRLFLSGDSTHCTMPELESRITNEQAAVA
jgi:hypothetical protein